jgi:N-acetylglutamate synthase-like GNAT family acetyltransferase
VIVKEALKRVDYCGFSRTVRKGEKDVMTLVRRATAKDLNSCERICKRVYPGSKWAKTMRREMESDLSDKRAIYLVAEHDGRVVGSCGLYESPSTWYISELTWVMVDPKMQRGGIGTALVQEAIKEAKSRHSDLLILSAKIPNYYRRLGFRKLQAFRTKNWLMGLDLRNKPLIANEPSRARLLRACPSEA